jgi:hypothetical protein
MYINSKSIHTYSGTAGRKFHRYQGILDDRARKRVTKRTHTGNKRRKFSPPPPTVPVLEHPVKECTRNVQMVSQNNGTRRKARFCQIVKTFQLLQQRCGDPRYGRARHTSNYSTR